VATLTAPARLLRVDRATWVRYDAVGGLGSAVLITMGAYAILAFDRFGIQGLLAPRATVRILLIGLYGWLWLAGVAWSVGRLVLATQAPFATVFRLYGFAHLPLLLVAITIQVVSVALRVLGPSLAVALLGVVVWMPALLVSASRQAFELDTRPAFLLIAGPFLLWLVVVGGVLTAQLGHLL
jgi:hypothetical protein